MGSSSLNTGNVVNMQYQRSPIDNLKVFFKQKSLLSRLILINIGVFLLISIVNLINYLFQIESTGFYGPIVPYLALPSDLGSLSLKPWTLLTYMFSHESFFHLFFNMLVLYFGGSIFREYLSKRKLLSMYLLGGISGGLLYVISYNYFPVFQNSVAVSVAIGASASVLAILVAIATYVPNYHVHLLIIGKLRLKYLAIILVVIDIISIQGNNPGGHIAHIGGALYGFISIMFFKKGFDFSKWLSLPKISFRRGPRKSYSNPNYAKRPKTDEDYNRKRAANQAEIDKILEKISKSGYASLSKSEKEKLFKMSNKK